MLKCWYLLKVAKTSNWYKVVGMKLIFYSPQFLPKVGGLENVVAYWAQAFSERGHEITVITTTPDPSQTTYAYKVLRNANWWKQWQKMRQADGVIMFNVSLKALTQWLLSGTPLVVSHHTALYYPGKPKPWQQKVKYWLANKLSNGNVCCSQFIAADYTDAKVIHSPYNPDVFFPDHALQKQPGSLLFVGRLVTDKGLDVLLEALLLLKDVPLWQLTIAGNGPEAPLLKNWLANEGSAITHRVVWLGAVASAELPGLYRRHEVLVIPSRMEPFGIVLLEGLACGCRVIAANQGGLPEAGSDFAVYVPPNNPTALAETIINQLQNPAPAKPLQALIDHLSLHTISSTALQLEDYLHTCLEI